MAFDDLFNILLVGLLLLVLFFQQRRKKAKQEEENREKTNLQIPQQRENPRLKEIIKPTDKVNHLHEALSDRYSDDPAYRLDKEKTTSFGRKLLKDKSAIKKGIVVSEIMKRPYD